MLRVETKNAVFYVSGVEGCDEVLLEWPVGSAGFRPTRPGEVWRDGVVLTRADADRLASALLLESGDAGGALTCSVDDMRIIARAARDGGRRDVDADDRLSEALARLPTSLGGRGPG